MNTAQHAYTFIYLLIYCAISVITIGAIIKSVSWAIDTMHHMRFKGKRLVEAQSAFDLLIKDCIGASEQEALWLETSKGWVYKASDQWVLWHQKNDQVYRKYGLFDPKNGVWLKAQSEGVAAPVTAVSVEPHFIARRLHAVDISFSVDIYEKKLLFHTTVQ